MPFEAYQAEDEGLKGFSRIRVMITFLFLVSAVHVLILEKLQ